MGNIDYSLPKYDHPRKWITDARNAELSWEAIELANKEDLDHLKSFLLRQEAEAFWPSLDTDNWKTLVQLQKKAEEELEVVIFTGGAGQVIDNTSDNSVHVPTDEFSSWQLYKNKLQSDGFKDETINQIENSTIRILKRLSNDTTGSKPIKGLVIGNVQSGKTANMAALMAMAADWGWNMFIILSGTIDNLRVQTQNRLFKDLNIPGNITWRPLEHLSKSVDISQRAQNLHFNDGSRDRYFNVCLKNSERLKKLIQWAQADHNAQQKMKILVIDDEADQAGINTGDVERAKEDSAERKKINRLICALVNGLNEKSKPVNYKYKAMNYIGYTATPYANVLNESAEESLYPRNFISTLSVSKEYFGPQQIFGYSGENADFSGLNIVRIIDKDDIRKVKEIHDGEGLFIPDSLKDAVCWFICGIACMRIWGYKKPVSMLIHTSQNTSHHKYIADCITEWVNNTDRDTLINRIKTVWERETAEFSLEDFRSQYHSYDRPDDDINKYPSFDLIKNEIDMIFCDGLSHINLNDEGELTYHKGIHLCIDNCKNNGIFEGMHVRLAYPDSENMPSPAPAFIVVGGATLSRGLTIEGLMSTYFLRTVSQADTLMQMGRWFGYRRGYELLPRLWISDRTRLQFEFLAQLDQELRDEILYMDVNGISPSEYGPRIKNTPNLSFIKITAKNRMQKAVASDVDYTGASNQTYIFDDNAEVLGSNIKLTEKFVFDLGEEWKGGEDNKHYAHAAIWRGISFDRIRRYIEAFKFNDNLHIFNDTKPLLDWIEKMTDAGKLSDWNVAVCGKQDDKNGEWVLPNGHKINKVNRSRKAPKTDIEGSVINIGALRDPRDIYVDVNIDAISDETLKQEISAYINRGLTKGAAAYRDKAGLMTTPQLLIYRVDKNSTALGPDKSVRINLNAPEDLIGICIYIPGGKIGTSYTSKVSIRLDNTVFDGVDDFGKP